MKILSEWTWKKWGGLYSETSDSGQIEPGFSPIALNWITSQDRKTISLRRGTSLLGLTKNVGGGKITGLGVGTRFDGTQVPFFSYGRKVKYYSSTDGDTHEVGTDILPQAVVDNNDVVSFAPYQNLAGAFVYITSPNSSIYKIPVANPANAVDQVSSNYRGFIKFGQSRSFLFNRNGDTVGNKDPMGLYASHVDAVALATGPISAQITGEAVGSLGSTNYTYTLSQITGKRTALFVNVSATVLAGTETFNDARHGHLVSNFGGTGTINYATGAIDVTFSDVTTGAVTASYYHEDATLSGVIDYSFTSPTRVAGEGNFYPQFDGGGPIKSVYPLATTFYSFHTLKTWQTSIPTDDGLSGSINLPFREKMGVKSHFGAFGGAEAIYYLNTADPNKPEFYELRLYTGATAANIAAPRLISKLIDFTKYAFDKAVVFEWGNYILLSCQQIRNGTTDDFNSRTFIYNKKNGCWDLTDYPASVFAEYEGTLLAGDTISNNVFTLFSGFDDDEALIPNEWTSGQFDFGINGQKRFSRMVFQGLIQSAQQLKVQLSFDNGAFVDVYTIDGTGSYVDTSKTIDVGTYTLGSKVVGGGGTVLANPFIVEFKVQTPRFQYCELRLESVGGGHISIAPPIFKDIREKSGRSMSSRTV